MSKPLIISITGTKGKTTTSRLISHVYQSLKRNTLLVDTDGHYLNGKQLSTVKDSMRLNGFGPTIAPGRYLYEIKDLPDPVAVLETSIGSSSLHGMAYKSHNVGVFTNLYNDHIGSTIKTQEELAERKARVVFGKIAWGGFAIFNADDSYVTNELKRISEAREITLLPIGINFSHYDIEKHLDRGGEAFTYRDFHIVKIRSGVEEKILDVRKIPWTFNGSYLPSIYNILCATAATYTEVIKGSVTIKNLVTAITSFEPREDGGRLVLKEKAGIKVLTDFAHETVSLQSLADLARSLANNRTIAVIRFARTKSTQKILEYSQSIADKYDLIIVYDKIDGIFEKPLENKNFKRYRDIGEVSQLAYDAIVEKRGSAVGVHRHLEEKDAVEKAFSLAMSGDIIVHMPNDHKRSMEYVKKNLERL